MSYDPHRDLYPFAGVAPDAGEAEIVRGLEPLRRTRRGPKAKEAAEVLLEVGRLARYDASRAQHRIGQLLAFDRVWTAAGPPIRG
jgi:hypothetical protein